MDRNALTEQAVSWLIRLEEDSTPQCQAEFTAWLERSPRNMDEFLLVTSAYKELDGLDVEKRIDVDELSRGIGGGLGGDVVRLDRPHLTLSPLAGRRGDKRRIFGVAAALGGAAIVVWQLLPMFTTPSYKTATGEQQAVKLDDGSVVQLNTQSRVQVHFSEQARDVSLLEGEALFVVEQDAKRPFRVTTETAVIEALGTQFNVYRKKGATTVSVLQGLVRIENAQGREDLSAGEAARIEEDGTIQKEAKVEVARAIAWRQRKLDFRGTPLSQVAAEFNRYNQIQIEVEPGAGAKELNGVFNADEPQSLLKFLEQDPTLQVERRPDRLSVRLAR